MNKSINNKTKQSFKSTRSAAIRARSRNNQDAQSVIDKYGQSKDKTKINSVVKDERDKLKVTILGGLRDVGEKNMAVIEFNDQAIILDCGIDLSVTLPGVNYVINDTAYLRTIKHKIKAYVITHGHLDHVGALKHTVPDFPAPIYGSRYSIGVIEKSFDDPSVPVGFTPKLVTMNIDNQEEITIGEFSMEFVRVTHSLPDATAICITTPVGRIIATGDFRLDPEPLDKKPTNIKRIKEFGDKGVLLLLSDSSYADAPGRVQTESTLQQSFHDIIGNAEGRIFVASFSSNMNRTQMIINAAVAAGRQVALDGRGMLSYAEIAVRQGILKVPKGTITTIQRASSIDPNKLLVMCTGGQGEENAALQRMSEGKHKYVNLNRGDTVVISSSPIPGNEISFDALSNRLSRLGARVFSHPNHEVDGCGPLHVSGHARRDELREMINLVRPTLFIPVHAGSRRRRYHGELAIEEGVKRSHVLLPENGDSYLFTSSSVELTTPVSDSCVLISQNGSVVDHVVVKDRLLLADEGIATVVVTIDAKTKKLMTSPDMIFRGFVNISTNHEFMTELRSEIIKAVTQRYGRINPEQFKSEIRDHIAHLIYEKTGCSPLVIPVINTVGTTPKANHKQSDQDTVAQQEERFQQMRSKLLKSK